MAKRYDSFENAGDGEGNRDAPYAWISEWLCEYVDGTMDPSMQAVFEEYMEANPELAAHVERLCRTRALLNDCECDQEAADRAKARLQEIGGSGGANDEEGHADDGESAPPQQASPQQIEAQIEKVLAGGDTAPGGEPPRDALPLPQSTQAVVAAASALTLMLGVGLFAGAVLFAERPSPAEERAAATQQATPDRPASPPARKSPVRAPAGGLAGIPAWSAAPLLLKKMPMGAADTAQSPSASPLLLQQAGLNTPRP